MKAEEIEKVVQETIKSLKTASELVEMFHKAEVFDRMEEAIREKKRQGVVIHRGDCSNPYKTRIEAIFYRLIDEEANKVKPVLTIQNGGDRPDKVIEIAIDAIVMGWNDPGSNKYYIAVKGYKHISPGNFIKVVDVFKEVLSVEIHTGGDRLTVIGY